MTTKKKTTSTASPFDQAIKTFEEGFESSMDMMQNGMSSAFSASDEQAKKAGFDADNAVLDGIKSFQEKSFSATKDAARLNADAVRQLSSCKTVEDFSAVQKDLATAWMGLWTKAAA